MDRRNNLYQIHKANCNLYCVRPIKLTMHRRQVYSTDTLEKIGIKITCCKSCNSYIYYLKMHININLTGPTVR